MAQGACIDWKTKIKADERIPVHALRWVEVDYAALVRDMENVAP